MRLVAAMNTRNELGRYLKLTAPALLDFVDELVVQDDGSDDGTPEFLEGLDRVTVYPNTGSRWVENEGELHQQLLDRVFEHEPTHVLAIDADEWVTDGAAVRAGIEAERSLVYTLNMVEMWSLDPPRMRVDGGWRPHPVGILYRLPRAARGRREWGIWGRKMAGGRVPRMVRNEQRKGRALDLPVDILHLGWSNPAERERRYQRYAELDGGKYHQGAHLRSILLPDEKCTLAPYEGPMPCA